MKFTIEFEQDNAIPFLNILVTRNQNNTLMTSIYRKRIFTGLYTKWHSFTIRKYKINLIRTFTYRYYRLCSSGPCYNLPSMIFENSFKTATHEA